MAQSTGKQFSLFDISFVGIHGGERSEDSHCQCRSAKDGSDPRKRRYNNALSNIGVCAEAVHTEHAVECNLLHLPDWGELNIAEMPYFGGAAFSLFTTAGSVSLVSPMFTG